MKEDITYIYVTSHCSEILLKFFFGLKLKSVLFSNKIFFWNLLTCLK